MQRAYYLAGWGWVAISVALIFRATRPVAPVAGPEPVIAGPQLFDGSDASLWFAQTKPFCNDLEVELHVQADPPPGGWEGAGYGAACYAIAGRLASARDLIIALPESDRANAAGILFGVGHPIADAGDDRSAGPIMRLVVEFQPWNYMALYHAGMSYYALGESDLARSQLQEFLKLYDIEDGWRSNANEVLRRLERERGS
jgi:hypothetical protein